MVEAARDDEVATRVEAQGDNLGTVTHQRAFLGASLDIPQLNGRGKHSACWNTAIWDSLPYDNIEDHSMQSLTSIRRVPQGCRRGIEGTYKGFPGL